MRPVLFLLYSLETILNLWAITYHVGTYITLKKIIDLPKEEYQQYMFSLIFQFITVLTMFSSIGICTGNLPSVWLEVIRTAVASICNLLLSIATMYDAEKSGTRNFVVLQDTVHPFFLFMRGQSICSLLSGSLNLLHCIMIVDLMMAHGNSTNLSKHEDAESDLVPPLKIYVLGAYITDQLEKYSWFKVSTDKRRVSF